jgi:hypothetical protein
VPPPVGGTVPPVCPGVEPVAEVEGAVEVVGAVDGVVGVVGVVDGFDGVDVAEVVDGFGVLDGRGLGVWSPPGLGGGEAACAEDAVTTTAPTVGTVQATAVTPARRAWRRLSPASTAFASVFFILVSLAPGRRRPARLRDVTVTVEVRVAGMKQIAARWTHEVTTHPSS